MAKERNISQFISPVYFPFPTALKRTIFSVCLAKEEYPVMYTQLCVESIEKSEKSKQSYTNFM